MNAYDWAQPKVTLNDETQALVQSIFQLVKAGETTWVSRLLQIGLTPNLCDSRGVSLLMSAVLHGHHDVARILLEHGADVNECAQDGRTPLMIAMLCNRKDVAELLISYGADPAQQSEVA